MRAITVLLVLFPFLGRAQNAAPVVDITGASVDLLAGTVTVTYDLSDTENDPCNVHFHASTDAGFSFMEDTQLATGSIGADITPANGLSITWPYSGIVDIQSVTVRVSADDGHTPDIQAMVDQVLEATVAARLANIAIPRHYQSAPAGLAQVRDSIWQQFSSAGLQTVATPVPYNGSFSDNVMGRQPGFINEARTFTVDAHYDAVANVPGADDNATGVVATLEIARILSQYTFKNSIRYIGFTFEEQGLIGSQYHVQSDFPEWETHDGTLNMEMIGYYSDEPNSQTVPAGFDFLFPDAVAAIEADEYRGNFLTVVGNTNSQSLINTYSNACDQYVPTLRHITLEVPGNGTIAPDLRRSDHASFWDEGIQALMLTDGSNFRNANYHTPNDVVATIDITFLTQNTKATLATAAILAEPINMGADQFDLANAVGITEKGLVRTMVVYPVPLYSGCAEDVLHIKVDHVQQARFGLFDLSGRNAVHEQLLQVGKDGTFHFSVGGLAAGLYVLRMNSEGGTTAVKVEVR
ncbi:MAG: M28 family peptidase [Flavobacteriales bacterium]|nr:M28 family peptidase [Flavobacteriales bacterium]